MMDYTVFKAKILTKSSIEIANASLFEILYSALQPQKEKKTYSLDSL